MEAASPKTLALDIPTKPPSEELIAAFESAWLCEPCKLAGANWNTRRKGNSVSYCSSQHFCILGQSVHYDYTTHEKMRQLGWRLFPSEDRIILNSKRQEQFEKEMNDAEKQRLQSMEIEKSEDIEESNDCDCCEEYEEELGLMQEKVSALLTKVSRMKKEIINLAEENQKLSKEADYWRVKRQKLEYQRKALIMERNSLRQVLSEIAEDQKNISTRIKNIASGK
jgi:hypothetical protein